MILRLLAGKLATAATATAVGVGGTTAAAYAGVLPEPVQQVAHMSIGAPAPTKSVGTDGTGEASGSDAGADTSPNTSEPGSELDAEPDSEPSESTGGSPKAPDDGSSEAGEAGVGGPVGPDATGPAAQGLCTAHTKGGLSPSSTAYRNLERVAGDAESIAGYCQEVLGSRQAEQEAAPQESAPRVKPSNRDRAERKASQSLTRKAQPDTAKRSSTDSAAAPRQKGGGQDSSGRGRSED